MTARTRILTTALAAATAVTLAAGTATVAEASSLTPVNPTPGTKIVAPIEKTNATSTTHSLSIAASATRVGYRLHYTRSGAGVSVYGITITSRVGTVPGFICITGASRSPQVCPYYSAGVGYQALPYRVWNTGNGIATRAWDNGEPYGSSISKLQYLP